MKTRIAHQLKQPQQYPDDNGLQMTDLEILETFLLGSIIHLDEFCNALGAKRGTGEAIRRKVSSMVEIVGKCD